MFVVVAVFAVWPSLRARHDSPRPEVVTLSTGATKRVANGRAQVWLGEIVAIPTESGQLAEGVEFEITCGGETFFAEAITDGPGKPICGCYVRLVETLDTRPPSARLEITWSDAYTPNLQAASQAIVPQRDGR